MAEKYRILMVSSAQQPEDLQNLHDNQKYIQRLNHQFSEQASIQAVHYNDIGFIFEPGKPKAFLVDGHMPLEEFDLIYIKSSGMYTENALALTGCFDSSGTPFVGEEYRHSMSSTKLSQYARLTAGSLPVPKALFIPTIHIEANYDYIVTNLGLPFILKDISGSHGQLNFLVHDSRQLFEIVTEHSDVSFVAQQFIPNDGDIRVLILGGKAVVAIGRARLDDTTHLNNTSQGASAVKLSFDEVGAENIAMAERSAKLFDREIAGADIMFEMGTHVAYLLEVNACPQVASGAFVDEKAAVMGEYLMDRIHSSRT